MSIGPILTSSGANTPYILRVFIYVHRVIFFIRQATYVLERIYCICEFIRAEERGGKNFNENCSTEFLKVNWNRV